MLALSNGTIVECEPSLRGQPGMFVGVKPTRWNMLVQPDCHSTLATTRVWRTTLRRYQKSMIGSPDVSRVSPRGRYQQGSDSSYLAKQVVARQPYCVEDFTRSDHVAIDVRLGECGIGPKERGVSRLVDIGGADSRESESTSRHLAAVPRRRSIADGQSGGLVFTNKGDRHVGPK